LQHWFTDVVGGWVVGALLLATFVLTASTLGGKRADRAAAEHTSSAAPVEGVPV
jgi:membrane-associated phospholipid phosphatase